MQSTLNFLISEVIWMRCFCCSCVLHSVEKYPVMLAGNAFECTTRFLAISVGIYHWYIPHFSSDIFSAYCCFPLRSSKIRVAVAIFPTFAVKTILFARKPACVWWILNHKLINNWMTRNTLLLLKHTFSRQALCK